MLLIELVSSKKIPFHPPFEHLARIAQFALMNKEFPPFTQIIQVKTLRIFMIKGRAIRKLEWEGGRGAVKGGEEQKKKKKKKTSIQARRVTLKNIHAKA